MKITLVVILTAILIKPTPASSNNFSQCASATLTALGTGWKLVRRVHAAANTWHPATDNLAGTAVYGTPSQDPSGNATFSINFSGEDFNQFLFMTGDCSTWVMAAKTAVLGSVYGVASRRACRTSDSLTSSVSIEWVNRGTAEDPWISVVDHSRAIATGKIVYGEASFAGGHAKHVIWSKNGANVFIRKVIGIDTTTGCARDEKKAIPRRNLQMSANNSTINFIGVKNSRSFNKQGAISMCASRGMHMATVKSATENELARRACKQLPRAESCCLGATTLGSLIVWDIDNSTIPFENNVSSVYTNWDNGEPSLFGECLEINSTSGKWFLSALSVCMTIVCDNRKSFAPTTRPTGFPTIFPTREPTWPTTSPTRSPTQTTRSPTQTTRSPTQTTRSPTQTTRSPTQTTRSPTQTTWSPSIIPSRSPTGLPATSVKFFAFPLRGQTYESECAARGLRAATIKTSSENALAQAACQTTGENEYAIGAYQLLGEFVWDVDNSSIPVMNNDPSSYANWKITGRWVIGDCVSIIAHSGRWNRRICSLSASAVVCDDRMSPILISNVTYVAIQPLLSPTPSSGPGFEMPAFPLSVSKENASAACVKRGMRLATIRSAIENRDAQWACLKVSSTCMIGASRVLSGDERLIAHFMWDIDRSGIPNINNGSIYANWDANEPHVPYPKDCIQLNGDNGKWSTTTCTDPTWLCDDRPFLSFSPSVSPSFSPSSHPTKSPSATVDVQPTGGGLRVISGFSLGVGLSGLVVCIDMILLACCLCQKRTATEDANEDVQDPTEKEVINVGDEEQQIVTKIDE